MSFSFTLSSPLSISGLAQIHAAAEERLWFGNFLFGTGEVNTHPFGPIDLTIEHDFYGQPTLTYDDGNFLITTGRPFVVVDRNRTLNVDQSGFMSFPPVWLKTNLPSPTFEKEARLVVQEGQYYFASGGNWYLMKGGYPYPLFNSKQEIEELRWNFSGLFRFVSDSNFGLYLDSGSIKQTQSLDLPGAPISDIDIPDQIYNFLYNPMGIFGGRIFGFLNLIDNNATNFTNIPTRVQGLGISYIDDAVDSDLDVDTIRSKNLISLSNPLVFKEQIGELITGILQARYLVINPGDPDARDSAREFGMIGAEGADTVTINATMKIKWRGMQNVFQLPGGPDPTNTGPVDNYELISTQSLTYNLDDLELGDVFIGFFSGVESRAPVFVDFNTDANHKCPVPVYDSLANIPLDATFPVSTCTGNVAFFETHRAYVFEPSDGSWKGYVPATPVGPPYIGFVEVALDNTTRAQRIFPPVAHAGDGAIPTSIATGTSGNFDVVMNLNSAIINSSKIGPKGLNTIYGIFSANCGQRFPNDVNTLEFAKRGESATYTPSEQIFIASVPNTPTKANETNAIYRIIEGYVFENIVLDGYSFLSWQ